MGAAYHTYRTITTLAALVRLTLQLRRCLNPACPHWRNPYRPAPAGRLALPHHAFGLDGLTCIGARRSASHRRVPDIQQALGERGGGPERPGRSPSSGSALRHWSPSPATPRRVSGVLRRRQGVASWPSMACNPRWARKSSGASALVSRARCAWPVAYGPPRTPTEPRCSARASRPWQGPVRAS
jgi:hypothetical protein